ncbi:hypothetical protein EK21DRAFT_109135 [Setomelanomma holmii]|uniref:WSC domain-containing protein n=1 Tax=Setomelanomma holmii TaxID=210430 RepID=A0A9P4HEX6_9PLEO|nr:hypothetical protein EK21DRAFT_109135 [Setomelanomma holmii]
MVLVRFATALAAASMLLTAAADTATPTIKNPITTPTITKPASALVDIGCFATGTPLENHGNYDFQSPGNCQLVCLQENKAVMGLSDGVNCWCGDLIPAKAWQVDNSSCETTCSGDDRWKCGGAGKLWIELTGNTRNKVDYYSISSSSSSTKSSTPATSAAPVATQIVTPSAKPKEDSKPNTAGIAAGVVVGIVGLGAIIGGVWFFMRRRRQKQAEEDYRRNAANVDQFVAGGKLHTSNSSMNDSRIDPSFVDRRQSNGSIADNEDYSRRILKVTNV